MRTEGKEIEDTRGLKKGRRGWRGQDADDRVGKTVLEREFTA
jgi:hypothetical protein